MVSDAKITDARGLSCTSSRFDVIEPNHSYPQLPQAVNDAVLMSAGERYELWPCFRPPKPKVAGSNPAGDAFVSVFFTGIAQLYGELVVPVIVPVPGFKSDAIIGVFWI